MDVKRLRRRLTWPFTYTAARVFFLVVQCLPRAALRRLASLLGGLIFLAPKPRRLILANLRIAFPEWDEHQRRRVGRLAQTNLVYAFLEFVWFLRRPTRIAEQVRIAPDGWATFQHCQATSGHAILLTPHLGCWELAHLAFNALGIKSCAVARQLPNPFLERLMMRYRTRFGAAIIHEKGAARQMRQVLREKQTLCLLVDQNTRPTQGGLFVPFFGLPATMSRAPALFARQGNIPVLVCACVREADGRLVLYLNPLPRASADYPSDEALTADICRLSEELVRRYPEQYLWLYERWRYIPPDGSCPAARFPYYAKVFQDRRDPGRP